MNRKMYVLVTGTGRKTGPGLNPAKRYLENGDQVLASVRKPSEALDRLKEKYPDTLHILMMDIASAESVNAAAAETLRLLFEKKRHDKEGPVFITHTGEAYPW